MYSGEKEKNISNEFPTLNEVCYLDHAGTTLYAKQQLSAVFKELSETVFGNPHSLSLSSRHTTDIIDQVRFRILNHFHTNPNEYTVVFTSSATSALKLIAENFIWKKDENPNTSQVQNVKSNSEAPKPPEDKCSSKYFSPSSEICHCEEKLTLVSKGENNESGSFVYLEDNHTSVLGMRESAFENGAFIYSMSYDNVFSVLGREKLLNNKGEFPNENSTSLQNSLFVYPAQSNFSGVKYPLSWISKIQSGILNCNSSSYCHKSKWFCVLDAASYVSTSDLDLSTIQPDFVCVSFYKIFGYPTGVGALLVKNSSGHVLKKKYFGGGTVQISLSSERFHVLRTSLSEQFEDGTVPFLSIIALRHGFDIIQSLVGNMKNVTYHTFSLAKYVHHSLLMMQHFNGSPAVILYSDTDFEDFSTQGSIVNFNLLRSNGEFIGFAEVLNFSNLYGIHLRTGCFCNPGACQRHLKLSVQDLKSHFQAGHVCGDDVDLINGKPTGSVRISFGYMSTKEDADKLLDMITSCFIDGPLIKQMPEWWPSFQKCYIEKFGIEKLESEFHSLEGNLPPNMEENSSVNKIMNDLSLTSVSNLTQQNGFKNKSKINLETSNEHLLVPVDQYYINNMGSIIVERKSLQSHFLTHIFLYPVKSCGPMAVNSWQINSRGLLYDREWMIVGSTGVALTQKRETKLCLIRPTIDLERQCLNLEFEGLSPISVPLEQQNNSDNEASLCESKVCEDYIKCVDCGDEVAQWICTALKREGLRLLRLGKTNIRTTKFKSNLEKFDESLSELSLANQAQFLLVNISSIKWLTEHIPDKKLTEVCSVEIYL